MKRVIRKYQPEEMCIRDRCCIDRRMKEKQKGAQFNPSQLLIAIDGMCGSGKTTLGQLLQSVYDCNLFHMDDFFLRPEQRTPERMAQVGGNVDYERFQKEILNHICQQEMCIRDSLYQTWTWINPSRMLCVKETQEKSVSGRPLFWLSKDAFPFLSRLILLICFLYGNNCSSKRVYYAEFSCISYRYLVSVFYLRQAFRRTIKRHGICTVSYTHLPVWSMSPNPTILPSSTATRL